MVEKICHVLFANDDIVFFDEDFGIVTFPVNEMGILSLDLNKIYSDDVNFYENDPETIIHVRRLDFWLGIINLNNIKHLKRYRQKS